MAAPSPDIALRRVSTRNLPEAERAPYLLEVFARQMCRLDFEPLSDSPLDLDATMLALPGLNVGWCLSPLEARWSRTRELVKDGDDSIALIIPRAGTVMRSQRGKEIVAKPGEGVAVLHNEPGGIQFRQLDDIAVMVPRSTLAPLVPDLEEAATRLVTGDALRLLQVYLIGWREMQSITDPAVRRLAITHVYDLLAMALGATRDAGAVATGRGVRAARLKAVKADISTNLTARDLSVATVALRQRVTPRYIHMLFENEDTTFSKYVLTERLGLSHRLLLDPRRAHQSIASIAYASGFGDLSHFNHAFRRRYGATPSEVRREQSQ